MSSLLSLAAAVPSVPLAFQQQALRGALIIIMGSVRHRAKRRRTLALPPRSVVERVAHLLLLSQLLVSEAAGRCRRAFRTRRSVSSWPATL